jgi:hypothetical protein
MTLAQEGMAMATKAREVLLSQSMPASLSIATFASLNAYPFKHSVVGGGVVVVVLVVCTGVVVVGASTVHADAEVDPVDAVVFPVGHSLHVAPTNTSEYVPS